MPRKRAAKGIQKQRKSPDADKLIRAIGQVIRAYRKRAQLTQAALGFTAGIDQTTLHAAEAGKNFPRVDTWVALRQALGISISKILEEAEGLAGHKNKDDMKRTVEALSKDELALVASFRHLNEEGRMLLMQQASMLEKLYPHDKNIVPFLRSHKLLRK